ncbi:MAG: type II secretion system protein GspG [Deltaproteobacteria bacterium]|nr:type II secretion system protein GspG [Deltaproteobacteria bacterium]
MLIVGSRYALHYLDRDAYLASKQAANHQRVSFYVDALERHFEWAGTYPLTLLDSLDPAEIPGGIARGLPLRDAWDHPLRYFSDGKIFLLVSVGRDGEPDGEEYHELRQPGAARDICGQADSDVVVSDLGWHVACQPDL